MAAGAAATPPTPPDNLVEQLANPDSQIAILPHWGLAFRCMGWARRARTLVLDHPERRRMLLAFGVYLATTFVYLAFASDALWGRHTPHNHFALLAEGWLQGRLSLAGEPPAYTGNNDFAFYQGRWYVAFPPFPAVLLVPALWISGGEAARVSDGRIFLLVAGIAPAVLFLVLDKLGRRGESAHGERQHLVLSLLFGFGSVYFFSAVQGTVWYAAHVVGAAFSALYLLFALGAERPMLAGLALGLGFLTRTPLLFAAPLFFFEAYRVCRRERVFDARRFARLSFAFLLPVAVALSVALLFNALRFQDPTEFGYRYLAVRWSERIQTWGLFHYHYLAKNLGVLMTSLPWLTPSGHPAPFQVNGHGLALWITTPVYLWLLWPRVRPASWFALWVSVACVALPTLFYQNTGWVQFGYRFSNDYAVMLFALLAIGGYRFAPLFWLACAVSIAINAFGALSFNRAAYRSYYFIEPTQSILYQPDRPEPVRR